MASATVINQFFAWAPAAALLAVVVAAYRGTRGGHAAPANYVKTFACARCGRRGKRDHMVPVSQQGAVLWYCGRCAH